MTTVERKVISPTEAKRLLGNNYERQRKVLKKVVNKYANDMKKGNWNTDSGGMIIISESGKLLDGQHRLMAVIQSGIPIPFWVQEGTDEGAYDMIDSGYARNAANVIGGKNATCVAALARLGYMLESGIPLQNAYRQVITISKADNIAYARDHYEDLLKTSERFNKVRHVLGRGAVYGLGAALYVYSFIDDGVVDYAVNEIANDDSEDIRVSSYIKQVSKALSKENFKERRQNAMTLSLLEAIDNDRPTLGRLNNSDSVLERYGKKISDYLEARKLKK